MTFTYLQIISVVRTMETRARSKESHSSTSCSSSKERKLKNELKRKCLDAHSSKDSSKRSKNMVRRMQTNHEQHLFFLIFIHNTSFASILFYIFEVIDSHFSDSSF